MEVDFSFLRSPDRENYFYLTDLILKKDIETHIPISFKFNVHKIMIF